MERDHRNSPLKLLALAASPLLLITMGVLVFAGTQVPRYLLITMAALAGVAIGALMLTILLADGIRKRHQFSKEYFWVAVVLTLILVANLVLLVM